jgi:aminoglycoside phosphotransferase (APT) family kinase protein
MTLEARTMEYLAQHGYPVPTVEELTDDELGLVMQRIDGPTMVEQIGRAPWTLRRQADTLAGLHQRLHDIPVPDFLPPAPVGEGSSVVHMDLHPLNVMIGRDGPVVIDWARACRGDPGTDVALAWLLMNAGEAPGGRLRPRLLNLGRNALTRRFLSHFDPQTVARQLRSAAAWKANDTNLSDGEIAALHDAVRRAESGVFIEHRQQKE